MGRDGSPLPKDGIYRTILLVLVGSVIAGAILALAGESYFGDPAISNVGTGIVVICGGLYLFFRLLGRREARRDRERGEED